MSSTPSEKLYQAAQRGDAEETQREIRAGADINLASALHGGSTPLIAAASGGHANVVQLLLELGANPNKSDAAGKTPWDSAAAGGDIEVCQILAFYGAKRSSAFRDRDPPPQGDEPPMRQPPPPHTATEELEKPETAGDFLLADYSPHSTEKKGAKAPGLLADKDAENDSAEFGCTALTATVFVLAVGLAILRR